MLCLWTVNPTSVDCVAREANAVSSRSHAVCIIRLFQTAGMLVLVDCAGSERKKDPRHRLENYCKLFAKQAHHLHMPGDHHRDVQSDCGSSNDVNLSQVVATKGIATRSKDATRSKGHR